MRLTGSIEARVRPGPGSGVLWVHGYTLDSTLWDELWELLPGRTHYGVDLPGHGASPPLRPGTTLRELGAALAEAAASHGVEHVVGLSLGSMVALQTVLSAPGAFETLTLAAPALAGGPTAADVGVRYRELTALYALRGPGPWLTELWMREPPATFAYAPPALRARLAAAIDRHAWGELTDLRTGLPALAREPQDARALVDVRARLLLVVGQHELPAFRRTAELLLSVRPDARCAELAGAGHLCILHAPHDAAALLAYHWGDADDGQKKIETGFSSSSASGAGSQPSRTGTS